MWDGIIVGGGLAGLFAGIRASERGRSVLIISEGIGSLLHCSGALDFGDVGALLSREKHPYALLGESEIRKGMDHFQKLFPEYIGSWRKNQKILTPLGYQRDASLVPLGQNCECLNHARHIVLMAPKNLKDFFPDIIKTNLKIIYPHTVLDIYPFSVKAFKPWYDLGKSVTGLDYARYWQSSEGLVELRNVFDCMIEEIFSSDIFTGAGKDSVVLFPGLATTFSDPLKQLIHEIPIPVVEMTAFPPSASGHELYCALKSKFKSMGGELMVGTGIQRIEINEGRCEKAFVKSKGKPTSFSARSFILATGGILGGGIEVTDETSHEPVLKLPLHIPAEWTRADFLGKQPYTHIGIEVDHQLRPTDPRTNKALLNNLHVVGRMVAHWDPWSDNCGGGVALATGLFAGELI